MRSLRAEIRHKQKACHQIPKVAAELRPDNCYAFAKLSRTDAGLYLNASELDPRRSGYRQAAQEMYEMAATVATPDPKRINWLKRYLVRKNILN